MPAQILEMEALTLIGRIAIDSNDTPWVVESLVFDAQAARVVMEIDQIDLCTHTRADFPVHIDNLNGWEVGPLLSALRPCTTDPCQPSELQPA